MPACHHQKLCAVLQNDYAICILSKAAGNAGVMHVKHTADSSIDQTNCAHGPEPQANFRVVVLKPETFQGSTVEIIWWMNTLKQPKPKQQYVCPEMSWDSHTLDTNSRKSTKILQTIAALSFRFLKSWVSHEHRASWWQYRLLHDCYSDSHPNCDCMSRRHWSPQRQSGCAVVCSLKSWMSLVDPFDICWASVGIFLFRSCWPTMLSLRRALRHSIGSEKRVWCLRGKMGVEERNDKQTSSIFQCIPQRPYDMPKT